MLRTRCCCHPAISQEDPGERLGWSELQQPRRRLWLRRAARLPGGGNLFEGEQRGVRRALLGGRRNHPSRGLWGCRGVQRGVRKQTQPWDSEWVCVSV